MTLSHKDLADSDVTVSHVRCRQPWPVRSPRGEGGRGPVMEVRFHVNPLGGGFELLAAVLDLSLTQEYHTLPLAPHQCSRLSFEPRGGLQMDSCVIPAFVLVTDTYP